MQVPDHTRARYKDAQCNQTNKTHDFGYQEIDDCIACLLGNIVDYQVRLWISDNAAKWHQYRTYVSVLSDRQT